MDDAFNGAAALLSTLVCFCTDKRPVISAVCGTDTSALREALKLEKSCLKLLSHMLHSPCRYNLEEEHAATQTFRSDSPAHHCTVLAMFSRAGGWAGCTINCDCVCVLMTYASLYPFLITCVLSSTFFSLLPLWTRKQNTAFSAVYSSNPVLFWTFYQGATSSSENVPDKDHFPHVWVSISWFHVRMA